MCLSFYMCQPKRLIAMNFDNNGMKFRINHNHPRQWIVYVDGGQGSYPSFGVTYDGVFANNLLVPDNGLGKYKRPSTKRTHTTKLVTDLLTEQIPPAEIGGYLSRVEVVNTPAWSTHVMVADGQGHVFIVEPGRGVTTYHETDEPVVIMSNESVWEIEMGQAQKECHRGIIASQALERMGHVSVAEAVNEAFKVLDAVSQKEGEWLTALSFVYDLDSHQVHYKLPVYNNVGAENQTGQIYTTILTEI